MNDYVEYPWRQNAVFSVIPSAIQRRTSLRIRHIDASNKRIKIVSPASLTTWPFTFMASVRMESETVSQLHIYSPPTLFSFAQSDVQLHLASLIFESVWEELCLL
jgi:hypothetical protein